MKVFVNDRVGYEDVVEFLGNQINIPFNITIDKKQDLGKKNKVEGASRVAVPAEIQGFHENLVAKRYNRSN